MSRTIYLAISSKGYIKLGATTQDLATRMRNISYDNSLAMMLIAAEEESPEKTEASLHEKLTKYRIRIPYSKPRRSSFDWYFNVPFVRNIITPWQGDLIYVHPARGPYIKVWFESGSIRFLNEVDNASF